MRSLVPFVSAVAAAWWMASKETSKLESTSPSPPLAAPIESPANTAALGSRAEENEQLHDRLVEISAKYAALLDRLPLLTASRLQALLEDSSVAREREISLLLSAEEYLLYEQLRESDALQAHLQAFASQVQTTSPLHPDQQRALLLALLNHSTAAQLLVLDPELDQANFPAMERAYARDVAIAGIEHHDRAFLQEVRPLLTREQWSALADFERVTLDKLLAAPNPDHNAALPEAQAGGVDNP
jgi:hypothetical protein